jgi:tetratricopeptide (TPR) repeat protein
MNIKSLLQKAHACWQSRDLAQAESILHKIIKKDKTNVDAHANLGAIYAMTKKFELSEFHLKNALKNKYSMQFQLNLINVLSEQRKYSEANNLIDEVLSKDPENVNLLFAKAKIIRGLGKLDEALEILKSLYEKNNNDKNIAASLAFTLNQMQRYHSAIEIYEKIIADDENFFPAIYNCGLIYINQRIDISKSISYLEKSLSIQPNNLELLLTLAAAYEEKYRFADALQLIEKAKSISSQDPRVYYQLGSLHTHSDNLELSLKNLNKCLELKPDYHMANYVKSNILLQQGKFDEGFELYKYRIYNQNIQIRTDDSEVSEINKEDYLLIFYEQGIGDIILYSRFFDAIAEKVKKVTILIPGKLKDFFSFNFKDIEFKVEDEFKADEYAKYKKINLATIPRLLKNVDSIINSPRIIKPNLKNKESEIKSQFSDFKLCGIAWKSNNAKVGDHKSIQLDDFINNIFNDTKYKLINLQYGDVQEEIKKQKIPIEITNVDLFNDISSTAALINMCDIVVTTSNVTAHIAGSLGKKTLLLVPRFLGKFWYWEKNLHIYKNIKIFSQDENGDWKMAMRKLKDYLISI